MSCYCNGYYCPGDCDPDDEQLESILSERDFLREENARLRKALEKISELVGCMECAICPCCIAQDALKPKERGDE